MESQARYGLVGGTVLILTAGIAAAVLWLAEIGGLRNARYFTIYFKDHTLYGLQQDSYVTMRGIKIGSVKDLQISEKNIEQIRVTLMLDADAPVKTDTVAMINRNLLTGFASIDLVRGTQEAPLLVRPPSGERYPVIPEGKSEFEEFADSIPSLMDKVAAISERIAALLSEENLQKVSSILVHVNDVTATLAQNRGRIERAMDEISDFAAELKKLSASFEKAATRTDARLGEITEKVTVTLDQARLTLEQLNAEGKQMMRSITEAARTISQDASVALRNLSGASSTVATTMSGFQQPRTLITGPDERALGPGERRR